MDGIDRVEDILGVRLDRRDGAEIAGVGKENIDLSPARHCGLHASPDRVAVRDIGGDHRDPGRVEPVESGLERALDEIGQHHTRPFGEEQPRGRQADAAGPAGDNAGFALQCAHLRFLPGGGPK